jgi:hypothetical protein
LGFRCALFGSGVLPGCQRWAIDVWADEVGRLGSIRIEFAIAIRLMVVDGLSGVEVSKKLGVNDSVIYRWEKEQLNEMEGVVEEYGQASPKEMSEEIHR